MGKGCIEEEEPSSSKGGDSDHDLKSKNDTLKAENKKLKVKVEGLKSAKGSDSTGKPANNDKKWEEHLTKLELAFGDVYYKPEKLKDHHHVARVNGLVKGIGQVTGLFKESFQVRCNDLKGSADIMSK